MSRKVCEFFDCKNMGKKVRKCNVTNCSGLNVDSYSSDFEICNWFPKIRKTYQCLTGKSY